MGITIHFEGRMKNKSDYDAALSIAVSFAAGRNWPVTHFVNLNTKLSRVRDEKDWDYEGPTSGIELLPHSSSEPFRLEFDDNLYVQEYTKTQFAPQSIHEELVDLLDQLEPFFADLTVIDEGEYYQTRDPALLDKHLTRCFELMDEHLASDPSLRGPVRLPSGRIADLIRDDPEPLVQA
jgi:hypothetical protein